VPASGPPFVAARKQAAHHRFGDTTLLNDCAVGGASWAIDIETALTVKKTAAAR